MIKADQTYPVKWRAISELRDKISPIAFVFYNFQSQLRRTRCASGFFDPPIDKRIACPYKFSKRSEKRLWEDNLRGPVRTAASAAWTLPRMSPNARRPRFDLASPTHPQFGRGCATRAMAILSGIIAFINFDRDVVLPKRGHGIEVCIH
jgi:hypothetical protein